MGEEGYNNDVACFLMRELQNNRTKVTKNIFIDIENNIILFESDIEHNVGEFIQSGENNYKIKSKLYRGYDKGKYIIKYKVTLA